MLLLPSRRAASCSRRRSVIRPSVFELFVPLLRGRSGSCPERAATATLPRGNADVERPCAVNTVPSAIKQLIRRQADAIFSLHGNICGGEPLDVDLANRFINSRCQEIYESVRPTETTTYSYLGSWRRARGLSLLAGRSQIPRFICLIRTSSRYRLAFLVELYIGGEGVARGYWNRPELTDEQVHR